MNAVHTLAIVGVGPRGTHALECFLSRFADRAARSQIRIRLFEASPHLGAGPVWAPDQPQSNWSNVIERVLRLPRREALDVAGVQIPAFPSFHEWVGVDYDTRPEDRPDVFPARPKVGRYLAERAHSLIDPLIDNGVAVLIREEVTNITTRGNVLIIEAKDGTTVHADQILLSIGHQPTELDEQLTAWKDGIQNSPSLSLHTDPYPVKNIMGDAATRTEMSVATRGFGLATIDIARALALAHGAFEETGEAGGALQYTQASDARLRIAPFSLDGLPLAPKPDTPAFDLQFAPSEEDLSKLQATLVDYEAQQAVRDEAFLVDAMAPLIAEIYLTLENRVNGGPERPVDVQRLVRQWLNDQRLSHSSIADVNRPTVELMTHLADIASAEAAVTLDYCIGQVWRHCHSTIYPALSHSALSDEAFAAIIAIDESVKRYSFGPPIASIRQLIALTHSDHLDLSVLNDPEITQDDDGWLLTKGADSFRASIMVNAVLDAPKLRDVNSPLVSNLVGAGLLDEVHDDLGIDTSGDGFVVSYRCGNVPIAVLGRLVKGSVMGVDDIVECFGERPDRWAKAAVARIS